MNPNRPEAGNMQMTDDQILDEFEQRAMYVRYSDGMPNLDGVRVIEGVRALLSASKPAAQVAREAVIDLIEEAIRDAARGADTYVAAMLAADKMLAASPAAPAQSRDQIYTMDQMRDYAEAFHAARVERRLSADANETLHAQNVGYSDGYVAGFKAGEARATLAAVPAQSEAVSDSWINGVAVELWKIADVSGFDDFKLAVSGFLIATAQADAVPPAQTERALTDRLIASIKGECDGLAITSEQASNILAYLQYGASMDDVRKLDVSVLARLSAQIFDCPLTPTISKFARAVEARVRVAQPVEQTRALTVDEYHEDYGNVVWWAWEDGQWLGEPAWIGTPSCSDWPGYHTHWTRHPEFPPAAQPASGGGK